MRKRYVFWRNPNGSPHQGADDKYAPSELLSFVGRNATVKPDGSVQWPLSKFEQADAAIHLSATIVDPNGREACDEIISSVIGQAIVATIKKHGGGKPVQSAALLAEADVLAAQHFRQPLSPYVMVSALSVKSLPARTIKSLGCSIVALKTTARFKPPEVLERALEYASSPSHFKSNDGLPVKVMVQSRSVSEAADLALDSMNLLRGLWTLFATYGQRSIGWNIVPQRKPIGVIRSGPIHTLHLPNGEPATDIYWYETLHSPDAGLFDARGNWDKIEKGRRWAMQKLNAVPYRTDLERLFIRYATALDNTDHDVAFLQMWALLEKITNTIGANYDETIRRATWGFKDRRFHMQILDSLRLRRNQYVHAARSGGQRSEAAYMIKSFVEPHLLALISNSFRVESLAEYGDYLSLPMDRSTLEKRQRHIRSAIRRLPDAKDSDHTKVSAVTISRNYK